MMLALAQCLHQVVYTFDCRPGDCAELQCYNGDLKNGGPYVIYPNKYSSVYANCVTDVTGGGWTVMLRREHGQISFSQRWREYKFGFGLYGPDSETWLGNEYVYQMSTKKNESLTMRVDAVSADGRTMTIVMQRVSLLGEGQDYGLMINGSETLQGVTTNDFREHNGHRFSTSDHDNSEDGFNDDYGGGGWWFVNNTSIYLSGAYGRATGENDTDKTYMTAVSLDGLRQLNSSRILIRPSSFTTVSASCTNPCTNGGTCEYMPYEKKSYCVCPAQTCGDTCQSRTGCDTTTTTATTERVTLPSKGSTDETTPADEDYEVDGATSHYSFIIAIVIITVIFVVVYVNACRTVWNIYRESRRARNSDPRTKQKRKKRRRSEKSTEKDGRKRVEREEEEDEEE